MERLRQLAELKESNLLTDAEYEAARQSAIRALTAG